MAYQIDWIQKQADKHRRLLELREIIRVELERDLPFSPSAIRTTLVAIRRHHGVDAELETRSLFNINNELEAA